MDENQFEADALIEELIKQRELWANEAARAKAQLAYAKKQLQALRPSQGQPHEPEPSSE